MSEVILVAGTALQWIAGIALVLALPMREAPLSQPGYLTWTIGTGALAGSFLTTLLMRLLSLVGVGFSITSIGVPLAAFTVACAWIVRRRRDGNGRAALSSGLRILAGDGVRGALRILWWALLAWMAIRFAFLLAEVIMRPLYPWDAWTQWATKAKVWYEFKTMSPFVRSDVWFSVPGAGFIDAGPHYPATVPLLMVWSSLLMGRWDDALMNLPFWVLAVGFSFVVFGFLRREGFGPLPALIGTWIASSLPLANAHVALAGYADLPLALYFAGAGLAGYRWSISREWADGILALIFALACPLLKIPGIVWMATLAPGLVMALAPRVGLRLIVAGFVAGSIALLVLAQSTPRILGYSLHLEFAPDWAALGSSYFLYDNWHLLWYGVIAAAVLARRQLFSPPLAALTVVLVSGLMFLFIVFAFTNARDWVTDQTTVNRATLHLAPLMAVWMLLAFRAWSRSHEEIDVPARVSA
jgi:hypothetical protein